MARPRPVAPPLPPLPSVPTEFESPARYDGATGPRDMANAFGPENRGSGDGTRVASPDPFLAP